MVYLLGVSPARERREKASERRPSGSWREIAQYRFLRLEQ